MSCEEDRCARHEMLLGFCHREKMKAKRRWDNPSLLSLAVMLAENHSQKVVRKNFVSGDCECEI